MDNQQFHAWAKNIRDILYRDIKNLMYKNGEHPKAIIAGGEYQYALMDDYRDIQRTADGGILWRGIPLIRCGYVEKVVVVWSMEDIDLPKPPKEGEE